MRDVASAHFTARRRRNLARRGGHGQSATSCRPGVSKTHRGSAFKECARQAIEATGQPGTIEISAGEAPHEWWIRVGDTGPGLPAKAREHLFEAFQGGARKGGTGLGLAIAAELVRGHGGKLELSRTDAEGTEFMIHLPRESVLTK